MHTVLLVEDNRLMRTANQRLLSRAGYDVIGAADGEEALKMARASVPDIIILDMMLPRISGENVLRALKSDPATAAIPVIVLSGLSRLNEAKLCREGASVFLEKNAVMDHPQELVKAVLCTLQALPPPLQARPADLTT
jgi:CheY-like chemotaxis protein